MTGIYRTEAGRRTLELRYRQYLDSWTTPHQEVRIPTRHGETAVFTTGSAQAPPVLLLHGGGTNSTIWLSDAQIWSRTRRVFLVDVLGEPGSSAQSRPTLASGAYAEWLDDVLDGLGIARTALVGASLGGWLAVDYTIRRPGRVERLALRAPGGIGRQRYGAVLAALALAPFGRRGMRVAMRHALGNVDGLDEFVDYLALIQTHYRPRREPLPRFGDEQLSSIIAPMLVTLGARDRMLDSRGTAERLHRLLPQATVTVHPHAGHALTCDTEDINRFLTAGVRS